MMEHIERCGFAAFNSNGVPGSYGLFRDKTLVRDACDLHTVSTHLLAAFPNVQRLFLVGLSTGAFLSVAYASSRIVGVPPPSPLLCGVAAIACVDDIPSRYTLDFTPEQLADFDTPPHHTCMKEFWPWRGEQHQQQQGEGEGEGGSGRVMWELHRGYLESYTDFPDTQTMVEGIDRNVKILLIHGE
ncbi:unnamed protein product [Vitrella brassicaformis CCMP3155]|uniref:Serine aminopeptidase S33 domain-containing protein n=1 Tax=Vitrella brassicaformis (strain CCMP3155) TaxID=1169540 RepID=A0A0G4EJD1_VITBC|nr:unnamed protein product [Vitrella brassicaformis CCMP3155]|eukprot:CEL96617.1 unnamed protein product [Vitrella brassicaformis CCMP3155]